LVSQWQAAISDAKRLQVRRHCRIKLVDEGKFHSTKSSPLLVKSLWSPILKEIKGDRGQFTVQYLLQRSVGDSDTAADALVWLVGGPEQMATLGRMNVHSRRSLGTTTPARL